MVSKWVSLATRTGLVALLVVGTTGHARSQVVYQEDFEFGWNGWSSDGVWDVGAPTVGPTPHGGVWCAGTNLDGNYPDSMSNRLQSPWIQLPVLGADEVLKLRYWYWENVELYTGSGADEGHAQILVNGGSWQDVGTQLRATSPLWTHGLIDLSSFQGQQVRIGFRALSGWSNTSLGWYVDDVSIEKGPPDFPNPENFENGEGDWSVTNGMWQIGMPGAGPGSTPSGKNCAGTHLDGNYWDQASTALVSPIIALTPKPGELPELRFRHWYDFHPYTGSGVDQGQLQLSVEGGAWSTLASYTTSGSSWTLVTQDLSAHVGKTIQVRFLLTVGWNNTSTGWYVDNFEVTGLTDHCEVTMTQFGTGLAGSGGKVPVLDGSEESCIGEYVVQASNALPGAFALLGAGVNQASLALFGGTWYVGLQPGQYVFLPLTVSGAGTFSFKGRDLSDYQGISIYCQCAIVDPGAVQGWALTNGLRLDV